MQTARLIGIIFLLFLTTLFAGCGDNSKQTATTKIAASMKGVSSVTGEPVLYGASFTLELPPGVTLKNDPTSVQLLGVATDQVPMFRVNTNPARTVVTVAFLTAKGFGAGQSLLIDCDIAPGFYPQQNDTTKDFKLTNFVAYDVNGQSFPTGAPVPTCDFY